MTMYYFSSKLKALKLGIFDDFLVHLVLLSLPAQFNQFNVSYNCKRDKWTLNELIFFCVQEEDMMKKEMNESAHFASIIHALICSEINLVYVPRNTWWINFGATTHVEVKAVGTFRLLLDTGFYLDFQDTCIVPSFRRNLVSVSKLDKFGYYCSFGNGEFSLTLNSNVIGSGSLTYCVKLYMLDNVTLYNEILHLDSRGTKRKLNNENSATLWHKRLCHISKLRMGRLVSDGVLSNRNLICHQVIDLLTKGMDILTKE
uniref:GAG-pre-integrase domain-containing protein n=1 Tax=Lactuca sativa TaxID=4236 RepID=A0A9R1XFX0_LACSA|nr:hypothetical protein LSAT_V11C400165350 [Lactuca sativa]